MGTISAPGDLVGPVGCPRQLGEQRLGRPLGSRRPRTRFGGRSRLRMAGTLYRRVGAAGRNHRAGIAVGSGHQVEGLAQPGQVPGRRALRHQQGGGRALESGYQG